MCTPRRPAKLDGPEGDEIQQEVAWFRRKYPTALDRLPYVRREMAELARVSRDGWAAQTGASMCARSA